MSPPEPRATDSLTARTTLAIPRHPVHAIRGSGTAECSLEFILTEVK